MNRKYLDDIGVTNRPDTWNKDDSRQEEWKAQRELYGFDERETWNLNYSFNLWLYERLKMYKEVAGKVIDLNYHKFEFEGQEYYTQEQMIDMILERLENSFKTEFDEFKENDFNYIHGAIKMFCIIYGALWW